MKTVLVVTYDKVIEYEGPTWLEAVQNALVATVIGSRFELNKFAIIWCPDGHWKMYHVESYLDKEFC